MRKDDRAATNGKNPAFPQLENWYQLHNPQMKESREDKDKNLEFGEGLQLVSTEGIKLAVSKKEVALRLQIRGSVTMDHVQFL